MALIMVNRSAEVLVVGQVDTLINFCLNMVRFRIRPDFFSSFILFFFIYIFLLLLLLFLYLSFHFFSFVVIAAV